MSVETVERWTYLGRRMVAGGKLAYAWRTEAGEDTLWNKLAGQAIGGIYDVRVVREPDDPDGPTRAHPPTWTGELAPEGERAVLAAADREAMTAKRRTDAEKRYGSSAELERALEAIERIARECKTWQDHDALQSVVRERIGTAWRKGRS